MTDEYIGQPLIGWPGDVPSLVTEMKRRAGVGSDRDLARYMGVAQSTVSHWRTRGTVPEAAILKFERALRAAGEAPQYFAARVVLLRLAEYWYQNLKSKGALGGRRIPYQAIALSMNALLDELTDHVRRYEEQTGLDPYQVADQLIEDASFLDGVIAWVRDTSAGEMIARELRLSAFRRG